MVDFLLRYQSTKQKKHFKRVKKSDLWTNLLSKDQFTFLYVCVCPVHLKRGMWKVWRIANHRQPLSDQSNREHDNPLKLDQTCDDVGDKLCQCDRPRISANFPPSRRARFPSIPSIFGESANKASWQKPLVFRIAMPINDRSCLQFVYVIQSVSSQVEGESPFQHHTCYTGLVAEKVVFKRWTIHFYLPEHIHIHQALGPDPFFCKGHRTILPLSHQFSFSEGNADITLF